MSTEAHRETLARARRHAEAAAGLLEEAGSRVPRQNIGRSGACEAAMAHASVAQALASVVRAEGDLEMLETDEALAEWRSRMPR